MGNDFLELELETSWAMRTEAKEYTGNKIKLWPYLEIPNTHNNSYEMLHSWWEKGEKEMNLVFIAREKYTEVLFPTGAFHFASGRKAWVSRRSFQNM